MIFKIKVIISLIFFMIINAAYISKENQPKEAEYYHVYIDLNFLNSSTVKGLEETTSLEGASYGENESIYKILQKKARYYIYESFKINKDIVGKIILADFPFQYDGELKFVFLVTYDLKGKQIDIIRIAKYENVSDTYYLETALIDSNQIFRNIHFEGFDAKMENFIKTDSIERYKILNNGVFKKISK